MNQNNQKKKLQVGGTRFPVNGKFHLPEVVRCSTPRNLESHWLQTPQKRHDGILIDLVPSQKGNHTRAICVYPVQSECVRAKPSRCVSSHVATQIQRRRQHCNRFPDCIIAFFQKNDIHSHVKEVRFEVSDMERQQFLVLPSLETEFNRACHEFVHRRFITPSDYPKLRPTTIYLSGVTLTDQDFGEIACGSVLHFGLERVVVTTTGRSMRALPKPTITELSFNNPTTSMRCCLGLFVQLFGRSICTLRLREPDWWGEESNAGVVCKKSMKATDFPQDISWFCPFLSKVEIFITHNVPGAAVLHLLILTKQSNPSDTDSGRVFLWDRLHLSLDKQTWKPVEKVQGLQWAKVWE